ncbi:MAG TPA: hypothetical protein VFA81_04020 [Burkholderiales bacterium]|nr:hypothetical protein [Burkholderiales bacterium]
MSWITDYVNGTGGGSAPVQSDATATPIPQGLPQPTIGPSTMAPGRFDALPRASVPTAPQGLPAFWQQVMDPSSKLGRVLGFLPPVSALQAGKQASDAVNAGRPGMAALTALGAIGVPESEGLLGDAERDLAPFGIHEAGSDHPTLAPRYEFTHPTTGAPNELVLAAEDGGKTLRMNNVGPVRTNYATAPTDANTIGRKGMQQIASWLAKQHPGAQTLIGDRGDGRIASIDLSRLR